MNILFLSENFPPETNAAATRVYERALYWVEAGHSVTIVTSHPNFPRGMIFDGYQNTWKSTETMDGLSVVRVKTYVAANRGVVRRSLDFISFGLTGWLAAMREIKPDVICATSPQFFAAVAAWLAARCRNIPFVFELGDLWPASISAVGAVKTPWLLRPVEMVEKKMYRDAQCIAALTQHFKDNLVSRGIPEGKIAVVRNGVDLWRYGRRDCELALAEQLGVADRFVVGYVGTHGMAHKLDNVLAAAEYLRDRPDICFLLVGDGADRKNLMAIRQDRGLDNVIMTGPLPKEMMPKIGSLIDVSLVHLMDSPLFRGVIPSKMFEAEGMGKPILYCAPAGEATGILEQDGAGILVEPENPPALAEAVRHIADDPGLRERLAESAIRAAPKHSRQRQAERMIRVLEIAADRRGETVADRILDRDA